MNPPRLQPLTATIVGMLMLLCALFVLRWWRIERLRRGGPSGRPAAIDVLIGFVTNFLDTLGIGSFAPTTAAYRLLRRVADEQIPGTLNVGHALPTLVQALIFIVAVTVAPVTLAAMIGAATLGAWLGAGFVARLPRRAIQWAMGAALLIAAALFLAGLLHLMPSGGDARGLEGVKLACAVMVSFVLGSLMMLGVGLYAPCLILVSLLGMNPLVAFPIMMGSCAFLMPVGGLRFVATERYSKQAALALAIGGIPAVLIAAYIVKSLPMDWLRYLVVAVVTYTGATMLMAATTSGRGGQSVGTAPM